MTMLVFDDGLAIDEETGEIVEAPGNIDRIPYLQGAILGAVDQEALWKQRRGILNRALDRLLTEEGQRSVRTEMGHSWTVAGRTTRSAPRPAVEEAVDLEALTRTLADDLILHAAVTLDPAKVLGWLEDNMPEARRKLLRRLLIVESSSSGYVRTEAAPRMLAKPVRREKSDA